VLARQGVRQQRKTLVSDADEAGRWLGSRVRVRLLQLRFLVLDEDFVTFFVLTVAAALAIPYPGWFSAHMLEFAVRSTVARQVVLSVTRNFQSIAWSIGLILLTSYFYAVMAYLFFADMLVYDVGTAGSPSVCTGLWQCWFWILSELPGGGEWFFQRLFLVSADGTTSSHSDGEIACQLTSV
jgi:hypothetical protein